LNATFYFSGNHTDHTAKQIFPEMKLRGLGPNSYIHVPVNDLNFPTIGLSFLLQEQ
jgi:hypothetical protein